MKRKLPRQINPKIKQIKLGEKKSKIDKNNKE